MTNARTSVAHYIAPAVLALAAVLAALNWVLQPERATYWGGVELFIGGMALVLLVARAARSRAWMQARDSLSAGVAFAGAMLVVVLTLKFARAVGLVADNEISRRVMMALMGAFFVYTGNGMPKTLTPLASLQCSPARVQAFQRFAGWTWVLTGIAFALAWLVLPVALAKPVSLVALGSGIVLIVAKLVALRRTRQPAGWPDSNLAPPLV